MLRPKIMSCFWSCRKKIEGRTVGILKKKKHSCCVTTKTIKDVNK
jgi:hypothetical protein